MNATDGEVQAALDELRAAAFVIESSSSRVMRYAHNTERVLQVPRSQSRCSPRSCCAARRPAGELRINCERLRRW
ncbi:MAG: DUF480 domain-containing protein [Burkholderiales bacterium]